MEYNKPEVLGKEVLALNESIATCKTPAAVGHFFAYEWNGTSYSDYQGDDPEELAQFIANDPDSTYYGTSIDTVRANIASVYMISVGGYNFFYEDRQPYLENWDDFGTYMATWTIDSGGPLSGDNWQNVHPGEGQTSVDWDYLHGLGIVIS